WVMAGVDDAVVLAQQFGAGGLGDLAKLGVDVSDVSLGVRDGDDEILVQGSLYLTQLFLGGLHAALKSQSPRAGRGQGRPLDCSVHRQSGTLVHARRL